MHTATNIFYPF